jgi:hypothetical protein
MGGIAVAKQGSALGGLRVAAESPTTSAAGDFLRFANQSRRTLTCRFEMVDSVFSSTIG